MEAVVTEVVDTVEDHPMVTGDEVEVEAMKVEGTEEEATVVGA